MLLHDDVVTDGEAKPGSFSGRFSSEERGKELLLHLWRNTCAVVADTDLLSLLKIISERNNDAIRTELASRQWFRIVAPLEVSVSL